MLKNMMFFLPLMISEFAFSSSSSLSVMSLQSSIFAGLSFRLTVGSSETPTAPLCKEILKKKMMINAWVSFQRTPGLCQRRLHLLPLQAFTGLRHTATYLKVQSLYQTFAPHMKMPCCSIMMGAPENGSNILRLVCFISVC